MAKQKTPWDARQIYEFIKAHRRLYDVDLMCKTLGVARSGFYAWLDQPVSKRARDNVRLLKLIKAHTASHGIYGSPRVFLDLREDGETCSKHRVARLMRKHKIRAAHGYRRRSYQVSKPSV